MQMHADALLAYTMGTMHATTQDDHLRVHRIEHKLIRHVVEVKPQLAVTFVFFDKFKFRKERAVLPPTSHLWDYYVIAM